MFLPKTRKTQIAIVVTSLVAFLPGSYMAQGATTTTLTFVVNAYTGGLSISVPGSGSLGNLESPDTATVVTARLDTMTVTDTRRSSFVRSWTTTAVSTDLLTGSETLTASSIGYQAGTPTIINGYAAVTEHTATNLSTAIMVQTGSTSTGNHIVSWRPTLSITIPQFQNPGSYSGTMTHSVF
jgi:hypothetical protein